MGLTPDQMGAAIARNMKEKTGRSLEEWAELTRAEGPKTWKERVDWLKTYYRLGHIQAQFVAWEVDKPKDYVPPTPGELLAAQYAGSKAGLRPIYDRLVEAVRSLGDDTRLDPRNTMVSLIRKRQFGLIQPSTRTRVDLGLRLPGIDPTERLQPAGNLGSDLITHRVALTSPEDVDEELLGWLRAAYDAR
jgi:hypothetical protein